VNPVAFAFFLAVIALTLLVTYWASRRNVGASTHYVAGGQIKGWQNGLAISGDYLSAASFLGIAGAIALTGFSGFYLSVGFLVAYLVVLLLVAEPLRNLGKYTVADALTSRFNLRRVRAVAALNTISISMFYMLAQLVGAGAIMVLLLDIPYSVAVIGIGILMTIYIVAGGMIATTWIQIIKAVLLMAGTFALSVGVLAQFNFNPLAMFEAATEQYGMEAVMPPELDLVGGLDVISLNIALVLGTAGLPHILIRFLTVPDAKAARNSVIVATWIIGLFYLMTPILGYGAAIFVGRDAIVEQNPAGNMAAPQLAQALGGDIFLGFITAVAFATIVAVVAGLVIAASGAFAHDFYTNVIKGGEASEREQFMAARIAAVGVSIGAMLLALGAREFNVAFLVALAFAVAASANLPAILFMIFWKRFNTIGAITGMLTGLISSVGLVLISPNVMGESAIYPLENPGIVSIPLGFLGCYIGTLLGGKRDEARALYTPYEKIYVQANTGIREEEIEEKEPAPRS
jgi:cation/acetate symporter